MLDSPLFEESIYEEAMKDNFGLYDTLDCVWFGDERGPKLFSDKRDAQAASQVVDMQLGNAPGRTQARAFPQQVMRLRDSLDTRMGTLEALQAIESGRLQ